MVLSDVLQSKAFAKLHGTYAFGMVVHIGVHGTSKNQFTQWWFNHDLMKEVLNANHDIVPFVETYVRTSLMYVICPALYCLC